MKIVIRPIKSILEWISDMKVRNKIMLCTSLLIILSTACSVLLLYNQSKTILQEYSYKETSQVVTQLGNYYNEKLSKIMNIAHNVIENNSFKKSLNNIIWNEDYNYAKESSDIQELFQKSMMKDRFISSMVLYTPKGVFYDNSHIPIDLEELKTGVEFEDLYMQYGVSWGAAKQDTIFKGKERIIPIILDIEVDGFYEDIYLLINISEKEVMEQLNEVTYNNEMNLYLIKPNGDVVTESNKEGKFSELDTRDLNIYENKKGSFKYDSKEEELYINYATIGISQWKVVSVQAYSVLMHRVNNLQRFAITIGIILFVTSTTFTFIIARTVTSPLNRLKATMEKVKEGNLKVRFNTTSKDEIGELGKEFDSMIDQIENLIIQLGEEKRKTKREQAQKIRAEIQVLQAQINPHFLYNTLDTIYWKSMMADNKLVSNMIISLADMLRIGLGKGRDIISVGEEIEHVRNYLYLQMNVYKDRFDYEIEVEDDVLECLTVKLLIQPLVENSILHGFGDIVYKGKINIKIAKKGKYIEYTVEDNGSGFDADKVREGCLDKSNVAKGFALRNVYERIKLHYNEMGKMEFYSIPYKKSVMKISIPTEYKEEDSYV